MAEVHWINIDVDMFDDEKIAFIESLPDGDKVLNIWIRLICMAGKCNSHGYIFISQGVPCSPEYLSFKFRKPINSINYALETFKKLGMIEEKKGALYLPNFEKHQYIKGLDRIREQAKLRKQKQRSNQKLLKEGAQKDMSRDMSRDKSVTSSVKCHVTCSTSTSNSSNNILYNNSKKRANKTSFIDFFNENFNHLMTPFELQTLQSYIQDGMEPDVITMALQEAVERNAREIAFVKAVLNRWLDHGIKTVDAVNADKRDFKNKKNKTKPQETQGYKDFQFEED